MRASEIQPKKLVVFDIDDTLVNTQTKVHVVKDGKVVNSLNSHDFTHYKLKPGESFDFEDFKNAREFFDNHKPIIPMMNQLKRDIATGNKVVMVTARADFDDKELFLDTFRKYGVDIDKVHVYRAGNSKQGTTEERKKAIIKALLDKDDYTKAIMYDDAKPNLHTFIELKKDHPRTRFYAWHVSLDGKASEYMREGYVSEKKRRRKPRWAAYGPGPYGGYGYATGYSGVVGGDGGAVGEDHKPGSKAVLGTDKRFGSGDQRIAWLETPLGSNEFGIRGFKVEFKKDGVYVSKNGKVVWSKAGDYSKPMNKHMSGVKKIITGLERQEKPFPGEYQQFGKRSEYDLKARREFKKKRSEWLEKVWDYAKQNKMSPGDVILQNLIKFDEASYPGNIGMMELAKFFSKASDFEKDLLKDLIKKKDFSRAWALIQGITGIKLQGKEFEDFAAEGWKDWVGGAALGAAVAAGGPAAYDAYKNSQDNKEKTVSINKADDKKSDFEKGIIRIAKDATPKKEVTGSPHEKYLTKAAIAAGIKGEELAQFLAQTAHESHNFKSMVEYGGSLDFKKYEPKFVKDKKTGKLVQVNPKAKTLGNTKVGDGARYKGRGYIQLTGRYNYKKAGEALGLPLESKPELVEKPEVAAQVAIWFWQNRVQPRVDDFYDTRASTKPINPGLKGLDDRKEKFKDFKTAMK